MKKYIGDYNRNGGYHLIRRSNTGTNDIELFVSILTKELGMF